MVQSCLSYNAHNLTKSKVTRWYMYILFYYSDKLFFGKPVKATENFISRLQEAGHDQQVFSIITKAS